MPQPSTSPESAQPTSRTVVQGHYYKLNNFTSSSCFVDVGSAVIVGLVAAIPVSIIDYSIISKVRGFAESSIVELKKGFSTLVLKPHKFFFKTPDNHYATVYRAVVIVYAATYTLANLARSYCDANDWNPKHVGYASAVASAVANISLTVWKDGVILKVFPQKQLPIPLLTMAAFAVRDLATVLAAFQFAPVFANYLSARYKPSELPLCAGDCGQMVVPAALQVVTTVIHILGKGS
ncbi:GPI-anchored surface protein, putative [Bodo saltans]|uniref:GPI-anchored surface protein, putative n=1 Tax=Bodo saltans TaxID=75058 RepID=A0A0S4IXN4_BODSA|nr:GPI-anchored surface protein, putative [Bodo saltans]|eukprot:CUG06536.1 GPI-anchored surface protein, putative [Bodo saltans]